MSTFDSFIKQWSKTPAANGTGLNIVPKGWPEGQAPSTVNDCARQGMSDHRYQWEDAEWFARGETVSRASATTFKIPTDVTATYLANRRIKFADSTNILYGTVVSSSYSAPDTTITVSMDNDTSLTASLSAVALSILSPTNTALPATAQKNKNLIIGGNFDTNPWQRGTSFTAPAAAAYTADRFLWNTVGVGVVNILKTADAPTVAQAGIFTSNCLHVDVTTADASIASGDLYTVVQVMEGYNAAQILQKPFTLSFWVKSTKTGIFCVAFVNSGNDRSYIHEYTVNSSDTWEKKTVTVPASPSAGTWNYTNGSGLQVTFTIAAGSTYQGAGGSWISSLGFATSNQVNGMDSTSNNFKLALIQIESGSTATPFEIRYFQEELDLCMRYFQKSFPIGTAPAQNAGRVGGFEFFQNRVGATLTISHVHRLPVRMRTTPTLVTFNPSAANAQIRNLDTAADFTGTNFDTITDSCLSINGTGDAGMTITSYLSVNYTLSAEL